MATVDQLSSRNSELHIENPATGEPVGTIPVADDSEVASAVAAARRAQPEWAAVSAEDRGGYLHKLADALDADAETLADLNNRETGKKLDDCRGGIAAGVGTLRQYAELGPVHRGHSLRGDQQAADYTITRPRGVVAAITPWNDPVAVSIGLIAAALVTGNTVIHKPSERNPHLGRRLGEVLSEVLPDDVLITLSGDGAVGRMLTTNADVDAIAHVGSTSTGRDIAAAAAETGSHVLRENGGNDPLLIDDTVDPRWAASQAATGAFTNAGQICTCAERIYVHRDVAEEFLSALRDEAREHDAGELPQPLVDQAHRELVHAQVTAAAEAGATVLAGGQVPDGPGAHYPATVLTDCTADMAVMCEETFGPVAAVQVVDSFDDGLRAAATDRYGLAATVLTARLDRALQAVTALEVGTVKVNNVFGGAPGGAAEPRRDSGAGFGFGPELLDEMTTSSVVHLEAPAGGIS